MGLPFTVAVECRARGRKETIGWIDGLIGKYIDVSPKVDRIVAVSKTGFPESAIAKAAKHGIETVKFEDAFIHDWPGEFPCLKVAQVNAVDFREPRLRVIPAVNFPLKDAVLLFPNGIERSLESFFAEVLIPTAQHQMLNRLKTNMSELFPNMEAVKKGRLFEIGIPTNGVSIRSVSGHQSEISVLEVLMTMKFQVSEVKNSFATTTATKFDPLNRICITSASIQHDDGAPIDVAVIQRQTSEGVLISPVMQPRDN